MEAENLKFLGVTVDRHLKFAEHLKITQSKIARTTGILFKLNSFLPDFILRSLYQTLIHPYLTYGIEAWFSAPQYQTNTIFILQKKNQSAQFVSWTITTIPMSTSKNSVF